MHLRPSTQQSARCSRLVQEYWPTKQALEIHLRPREPFVARGLQCPALTQQQPQPFKLVLSFSESAMAIAWRIAQTDGVVQCELRRQAYSVAHRNDALPEVSLPNVKPGGQDIRVFWSATKKIWSATKKNLRFVHIDRARIRTSLRHPCGSPCVPINATSGSQVRRLRTKSC